MKTWPQFAGKAAPIVREKPFAPWPKFAEDEIAAVARVLASGKVNYWAGDEGKQFEAEFAAASGCRYGVALANGTAALELALRVLGVGSGDEVITSSRTFIASASCTAMVGARPVFVDVDSDSQNVTAATLRGAITPRTRAIVAVHLAGWPCEMDPILELARETGIKVIEDCAQAHGAQYRGQPVGSMGDVGAFSFCQEKIMTTGGEGGMLVTNDGSLYESAWSLKDHGKSYDAVFRRSHPPGFRWVHESIGSNWRLTEMQSAIGRIQLKKLPEWVAARRRNAVILTEGFSGIPALRVTRPAAASFHSYYKYDVFVRPELLRREWTRERIVGEVEARGIPCSAGGCGEIYLEKAFEGMRPKERLPVAKLLGETSLMFQVHPTLTEEEMRDTIRAVEEVMAEASR
jgi:dTDP-4-amino-4,6-dideoxygalactose transaminase